MAALRQGIKMADHRMFSARITESTKFLKMPVSSQNLYFHLGMKADDDGVVEAYPVMCVTGATEDDLKVLVAKNLITVLNNDYVSHISDWLEHNKIRADRKKDSIYKDLLLKVIPDAELLEAKESYYSRQKKICQTNDGQITDKCQQNDRLSKDKVSKDKVSKDKVSKDKYSSHFETFWKCYPRKIGKAEAYKCYQARLNDGYSEEELLQAVKNYAETCKAENREEKYIKHAKTFLGANTPFVDYLKSKVPETPKQQPAKGTKFSNFDQRDYDFDALEKSLLNS